MRLSSESLSTYGVTLPGIRSLGLPATQARHRNPHIHARLFVDCALQAPTALENHAWHLHQRAKTSSGLCPPAAIGATHLMYLSPEDASRRSRLGHSCSRGARQCCFRESYLHVQSLCAGCPRDLCANHMLLHHHILHLCLGVAPRPITTLSPAGSFTRAVVLLSIRGSGAHSLHTCTSNPGPEDASRTMRTLIQQWLHDHALDSLARSGTANTHPCTPVVKASCMDHDPHECKFHTCALQAVALDADHLSASDQGGTLHCHPHPALIVEKVHVWTTFHPSWHDPQRATMHTAHVVTPSLSQVSREVASTLPEKALRNTHAGQWLYLTLAGAVMYLPARPEGATEPDLPYWNLLREGSHQLDMSEPIPLRRSVQQPILQVERNNAILPTCLGPTVHAAMYTSTITCRELGCTQLHMFLHRSCSNTSGNRLARLVISGACTRTVMHPIIHHIMTNHSGHPPRAIPDCNSSHLPGALTMTKRTSSRQKSQKQRAREARRPSRHERLGLPKPPPRHTTHRPPAATPQPPPPTLLGRVTHPTRQPPPPPPPPNRAPRDGTTKPHLHTAAAHDRRPRTPPPARREQCERTHSVGARHRPPLTSPTPTEHMPNIVNITTVPLRSAQPLAAVDDSTTEYSSDTSDDSSNHTTLTPLPCEVSRPCPAGLPTMPASVHPLMYPPKYSGTHQLDQPCTRSLCLNRDHCICTAPVREGLFSTLLCIQIWHLYGRTTAFFGCFLSSFEWRVWPHRPVGQWSVTRVIPGTYRRRWRRLKNAPGCHRRTHAFKGLACLGCSIHVLSHFSPKHSWNLLGLLLYFLTVVLMRQWFVAQRLRPWPLLFPSPPRREPTLSSRSLQGLPLPQICPWQPRHDQPIAHVCTPPRYHPPGLSLYAPSPSATQIYPAALLHIRRNLHWTGRPGPKSGDGPDRYEPVRASTHPGPWREGCVDVPLDAEVQPTSSFALPRTTGEGQGLASANTITPLHMYTLLFD